MKLKIRNKVFKQITYEEWCKLDDNTKGFFFYEDEFGKEYTYFKKLKITSKTENLKETKHG